MIDWIHRVEHDLDKCQPTKRLHSLVTEIYFEQHLSMSSSLNLPSAIAFGWIKRYNREKQFTEWFKIASQDSIPKKQPSLRFIKEMAFHQPQDRFYLIEHRIDYSHESILPLVIFKVRSLLTIDGRVGAFPTEESLQLSKKFTQNSSNKLNQLISTEPIHEIEKWLKLLRKV
ncbi:hypothetical protein [Chromobacterium amazonense]|uniref:hypothetical protein n=1 Tax=Chromobacterium amazonense TaxID=1382803 RepID=UPI001113C0F6|nr:hypothetical protein [Chromobacterium amazonense]